VKAATDAAGMNYLTSLPRRLVTLWLPLGVFLFVLLFPFYWMVITTFKPNEELLSREGNPFWVKNPTLADARLARVREGGLETLRFGWAGSSRRGEPYYFRVQGARMLIELDNSGGNHIHSVWRDAEGDWGRDVLREHYRRAGGTPHKH